MKIYTIVPEGMKFEKVKVKEEIDGEEMTVWKDCLVDPLGEKEMIPLQDLVKTALRTNNHRELGGVHNKTNPIPIYLRKPPLESKMFLEYEPEKNGKEPTKCEPKLVTGLTTGQKHNPNKDSRYGTFWHQHADLSEEKKKEIENKKQEQKENRRHTGDNPSPT